MLAIVKMITLSKIQYLQLLGNSLTQIIIVIIIQLLVQ